jgi:predicted membrane protein
MLNEDFRNKSFVIKVIYSPTNAQVIALKTVLKFTLK